MSDSFQPGVYAKGDKRKRADRAAQAVALEFDGYKRVEDTSESAAPTPDVSDTAEVKDDEPSGLPAEENVTPSPSTFAGRFGKS